jgi:hypothetical protein
MWLSRRELARLERELNAALQRAKGAEDALAAERQRHDWLILQLTNRVVTKHGGYGLEEAKPEPVEPNPKGFTREPTQEDIDVLNFYKNCAAEAGLDDAKATEWWEAHMRGEAIPAESREM